jgi:hypothetical protein
MLCKPRPASDGKHKEEVDIIHPITRKVVTIRYGNIDYEDFTQHHDEKRKENYLARSGGIRRKDGSLTKDDPTSPNYWARRELWDSGEKYDQSVCQF